MKPNVRMFHTERQANFRQHVRKEVLQDGKREKDAERKRMEEFRKLCKKEGIVSQRLAEYDAQREAANEALQSKLDLVDRDESLTNAERRKRKFALKQKIASTPIGNQNVMAARKASPMIGLEKKQEALQRAKEEKEKEMAKRLSEKKQKLRARKEQQSYHQMRTKKGQPVMNAKVSALLQKL